ncbi:MAG TPA: nucleotide sugar dehydrogenase [Candidatus Nanopelagicales bacterium]|nr:nucleotide sugar dehydrogenase [Candidatus Nanopelagicales bacterium]
MSDPQTVADNLLGKITSQNAQVGIIGLGYVGLPLALAFIEKGFRVLGFDVDPAKVEALAAGESYIKHLDPTRVAAAAKTGRFLATTDFGRLGEPDAVLICVPTPLTPQREPDMSYVVISAEKIRDRLRRGQLIVLESTTYPGTTDELVLGILEQSGLKSGHDFFLAFSPEREDPGNRDFGTTTIPKVVGGVDKLSLTLATALYDQAIARTVPVSSARAAEASKLTENIFRAVNIALVNELKVVYDKMGIDVWEVLDAASTKPFGFMRFNPGPGWGGHCIPLDPFYLSWKAREYGASTAFIELAGEVNVEMPHYVVSKLQLALNDRSKPVKGMKVLILGIAYKKDIDDPRESPAFEVFDLLRKLGAQLSYHDPHIAKMPSMRSWPHLPPMESLPLTQETLAAHDAVVIVTDHSVVDYGFVLEHAQLIVDTRGIYRQAHPKVVKA